MHQDEHRRPGLEQLLTAPLSAVANAGRELAGTTRAGLRRLLEADRDGTLAARQLELPLGGSACSAGSAAVRVPLAALVPVAELQLERGRVSLAVELRRSVGHRRSSGKRLRFESLPAPTADRRRRSRRGAFVEVEIEVLRAAAPDGWKRIEQCLADMILEPRT